MFNTLNTYLEKPPLYAKSKVKFWDDSHISKHMLNAHLDPNFDGASRTIAFIEKSVQWIKEITPSTTHPNVIDIGCGPGIYSEKFVKEGYSVTGIDFSERSIEFARSSASKRNLNISYFYQDYLNMDLNKEFNLATFIFCDYGALSSKDRHTILNNIYRHLLPDGKCILDVFSIEKYYKFQENQTWENCPNGGFWSPNSYIALHGNYIYPSNVSLEQTTIISNDKMVTHYIWNTYFTKELLFKEAKECGFKICDIFSDVAGSPYSSNSETIAIILEK